MTRVALALLALLVAAPAHALDAWMWGVGPKIGTSIIPGHYPSKFPKQIHDSEELGLSKFRDDFLFGVEGVYYVNKHTRTQASLGMGVAKGFTDYNVLLKYNYVAQTGAMDFLFGGGLGVGTCSFKAVTGLGEKLKINYYPFRVEGSALIRDSRRAYQLTLFLQYNLPSNQMYSPASSAETLVGGKVSGGVYATLGLEAVVYFGDFIPPKRKKPAS